MPPGRTAPTLPLAELVASMALATDLAMGHPVEQGLGTCIISTRLAELAGLSAEERVRTYYLALLRHIGCTTDSHELAQISGDEIELSRRFAPLSGGKASSYMRVAIRAATEGLQPWTAVMAAGRLLVGMREFDASNKAICEVAQLLAARLGFDQLVVSELPTVYERWDGRGTPNHVKAEAIPLTVRITQVADLATVLHDLRHDDPAGVVAERAGTGFDPAIVELFRQHATELLDALEAPSRWQVVVELAPERREISGGGLADALSVVADFADLKSPFLVGHSSGVAWLAHEAATNLPLPATDAEDVRHVALVHDLGRVGVTSRIWGKPGPLDAGEWEAVRLHPYHTERLLSRSPFLARLAAVACMHHERLDGSGYVRGVVSERQTPTARLLAAADAYHAMTEPRPHRPVKRPEEAATEMEREVRAGRIDRASADAVLEAAGHPATRRKRYTADLTAREIEVLRLVARGLSLRDVAQKLVISPRTADNHLRSIYSKVGVSTRAAATVFAMQHGLVEGGPAER